MKKILISLLAMLAAVGTATAQEFATTYFLDNNLYSYRINPAIPGEKSFFGLVISNMNMSFGSNTGCNALLYPSATGGLVTGFHGSVSAEQFLSKLPRVSRLDQTLNENLIATGFWTRTAFHSVEVNVKEDVYAGVPKELFEMFKVGSRSTPYDLAQTRAAVKSYAELAYGYTRKINDKFSVGGRAKLLMGLAAGDLEVNKGSFTINGDKLSYDLDAKARLSSNFIEIGTKAGNPNIFNFSAFNLTFANLSPCGWGGAVDLGMTYKPVKGLTLSFSVLDLGAIAWKYNIVGQSKGADSFTGETIKSDGTVSGDLEKFLEKVNTLADFEKVEGGESSVNMLTCTVNLGARYYMPFYERLSVGLLATYRADKYSPLIGARLGATVTPVDWFSLTGNFGVNNYCATYGAALSINAANLNFTLGYEGYSGSVSKVQVADILSPLVTPLGSFQNMVKLGINITFEARHNDFKPVGKSFIHGRKAVDTASAATEVK